MYLKSLSGDVLFESKFNLIQDALRDAVDHQTDLSGVNLRRMRLDGIGLEKAQMKGACLWGASLKGAEFIDCSLGSVDFRIADLRAASVKGSCLAQSNLRGAKVGGLSVYHADLSYCVFSDPSFFDLDLCVAARLNQTIFTAYGERDYLVEEHIYPKISIA